MALNNFENKESEKSGLSSPKPCSRCFLLTKHDDLIKYGSFCEACYNVYCYDAPGYPAELNKYTGDPKGWAKRIIDKHNAGIEVRSIALKFAKEALG